MEMERPRPAAGTKKKRKPTAARSTVNVATTSSDPTPPDTAPSAPVAPADSAPSAPPVDDTPVAVHTAVLDENESFPKPLDDEAVEPTAPTAPSPSVEQHQQLGLVEDYYRAETLDGSGDAFAALREDASAPPPPSLEQPSAPSAAPLYPSLEIVDDEPSALPAAPLMAVTSTPVLNDAAAAAAAAAAADAVAPLAAPTMPVFAITRALSDGDRAAIYTNRQLAVHDDFVADFLGATSRREDPFFALLDRYRRACDASIVAEQCVSTLQRDCLRVEENVWTSHELSETVSGQCGDQRTVQATVEHHWAEINPSRLAEFIVGQQAYRSALGSDLVAAHSECDLVRAEIHHFLASFLTSNAPFNGLTASSPIVAYLVPSASAADHIDRLHVYIDALFAFVRDDPHHFCDGEPSDASSPHETATTQFVRTLRAWIRIAVSALLRVATYDDHKYLLHHFVRCPGIAHWGADLLQFPPVVSDEDVDHFTTMLHILLHPDSTPDTPARYIRPHSASSTSRANSEGWLLLDTPASPDDIPPLSSATVHVSGGDGLGASAGVFLDNGDFCALLDQFPFTQLFSYVMNIEVHSIVAQSHVADQGQSAAGLMRLLVFARHYIDQMCIVFMRLDASHYSQVLKRVARAIAECVRFLAVHWQAFQLSPVSVQDAQLNGPSLDKLNAEFSSLFEHTTEIFVEARRLGVWQFMVDLPFGSVNDHVAWRVFALLFIGQDNDSDDDDDDDDDDTIYAEQRNTGNGTTRGDHRMNLRDRHATAIYRNPSACAAFRDAFLDRLVVLDANESVFFLHTLAALASTKSTARPLPSQQHLASVIACELFLSVYLAPRAPELLYKPTREALSIVTRAHPHTLSLLFAHTATNVERLGGAALYLFQSLDYSGWVPSDDDFSKLERLLLEDHQSVASEFARLVLSHIAWRTLPQALHRRTALIVVSAYNQALPEDTHGTILSQAKHLTRTVLRGGLKKFVIWCWDLVLSLRLRLTAVTAVREPDLRPLHHLTDPDVGSLVAAARTRPLAAYVTLQCTFCGYSAREFVDLGLPCLQLLLDWNRGDAAVNVLDGCRDLFASPAGAPIFDEPAFLKCVITLIHPASPVAQVGAQLRRLGVGFDNGGDHPCTADFVAMVADHARHSRQLLSSWLRTVSLVPSWHQLDLGRDLVEVLLSACPANQPELWAIADQFVISCHDGLVDASVSQQRARQRSLVGTLVSMVSSATCPPSLLDAPALSLSSINAKGCHLDVRRPYLAFHALSAEASREQALRERFVNQARKSPEVMAKAAGYTGPLDALSIYKWLRYTVAQPLDSPLITFFWQAFFMLFLKPGMRYFFTGRQREQLIESTRSRLKALTNELRDRINHEPAEAGSSAAAGDRPSDVASAREEVAMKRRSRALHGIFATMIVWLNESRLHSPEFNISTLPSTFDVPRLVSVMQANPFDRRHTFEPLAYASMLRSVFWFDLAGDPLVPLRLLPLAQTYPMLANDTRPWRHESDRDDREPQQQQLQLQSDVATDAGSASEAAIDTIATLRGLVVGNVAVAATTYTSPRVAVPLVDLRACGTPDEMVAHATRDVQVVLQSAGGFAALRAELTSLDADYAAGLEHLFHNSTTPVVLQVPCKPWGKHTCIRAAQINANRRECTRVPVVVSRLAATREQSLTTARRLRDLRPINAVHASLRLLDFCRTLVDTLEHTRHLQQRNMARSTGDEEHAQHCAEAARQVFFHVAGTLDAQVRSHESTRIILERVISMLGLAAVATTRGEPARLMQFLEAHTDRVTLLAPYFNPIVDPDQLVALYRRVSSAHTSLGVGGVFLLLGRFDIAAWLALPLAPNERVRLLKCVVRQMRRFGAQVAVELKELHTRHREHMRIVSAFQFPSHVGDALAALVDVSTRGEILPECWSDLLGLFQKTRVNEDSSSGGEQLPPPFVLHFEEAMRLAEQLHTLLSALRASRGHLYDEWIPYLGSVAELSEHLVSFPLSALTNVRDGNAAVSRFEQVWSTALLLYGPWLAIDDRGREPWSGRRVNGVAARAMAKSFLRCVQPLQHYDLLRDRVLSWLSLNVCAGLTSHCLVLVQETLLELSWEAWDVTVDTVVASLVSFVENGPSECASFVAQVMLRMRWTGYVEGLVRVGGQQASDSLIQLLRVLLWVTTHNVTADKLFSQFLGRLTGIGIVGGCGAPGETPRLPWRLLGDQAYETIARSRAYLAPSDAAAASERGTRTSYIVDLMRVAAQSSYAKTLAYVELCVSIVGPAVDIRPETFSALTRPLMDTIAECVTNESLGVDDDRRVMICRAVLNMANLCAVVEGAAREGALNAILGAVCFGIRQCPVLALPALRAACKQLSSAHRIPCVVETCCEVYFASGGGPASTSYGWSALCEHLAVPELSYAEFVTDCVSSGCPLTLHAHMMQVVQQPSVADSNTVGRTPPAVASTLLRWASESARPRPGVEDKCVLLWALSLSHVSRVVIENGWEMHHLRGELSNAATLLRKCSADRESGGILGTLGFGSKSLFSAEYRAFCRSCAYFLTTLLPISGSVIVTSEQAAAMHALTLTNGGNSSGGGGGTSSGAQFPADLRQDMDLFSTAARKHAASPLGRVSSVMSRYTGANGGLVNIRAFICDIVRVVYPQPLHFLDVIKQQ